MYYTSHFDYILVVHSLSAYYLLCTVFRFLHNNLFNPLSPSFINEKIEAKTLPKSHKWWTWINAKPSDSRVCALNHQDVLPYTQLITKPQSEPVQLSV